MKLIVNSLNRIPLSKNIMIGGVTIFNLSIISIFLLFAIREQFSFDKAIMLGLFFLTVVFNVVSTYFFINRYSRNHIEQLAIARTEVEIAMASARSKMDFLSRMSHEIRTPLGAIIGFGQLLGTARLTKEQKTYLESINLSGKFLLRIINDILDLSKIEASGIEMEMAPFRLCQLTENVSQMIESEVLSKGIKFITECEEMDGKTVMGDQHRLKQILMNLIANAIKFTDRGEVFFRVKTSGGIESGQKTKVRFEVEDSGIGMSPRQLEKVFQPFSQGDAGVSRRFGGTGLGLSIAQSLVESMGGTLEAISVENSGSTFSFELDLLVSDEIKNCDDLVDALISAKKSRSKRDLRILVAEDEAVNRTLITKFFAALGYPVEFAEDGQDCIDRLSCEQAYDAIFLDLHMPHCHGMEIAKRIKNGDFGEAAKSARLAIMSADVLADQKGKELGVDAFIFKPINISILKEFLDSIVPRIPTIRPMKALIVEDQALNRQMIGHMLTSFGMEPNFANDGVECIEFLESHSDLDLILLDLRMPRMDGWTVARKIRSGEAGVNFSKIPIAVVSAEIHSEETCRQLGVDEFISKPFDVSQIRNFVDRVSEKNRVALSR